MEGDKVGVWGDECNEDGTGMVLDREDNMEDTPWGRWAVEVSVVGEGVEAVEAEEAVSSSSKHRLKEAFI